MGLDADPYFSHHAPMAKSKHRARQAKRVLIASALAVLGLAATGLRTPDLEAGEVGKVRSVLDGDTLYLDSGLKVRLSGIQAPKLPLGRKGFKAWPLGEAAKSALEDLTRRRDMQLYYGGNRRDRYDRALAQLYTLDDDGNRDQWMQEEMLRLGMARVYSWPDTYQDTERLYAAERAARAEGLGIWGHPFYDIRSPDPDPLAQDVDSFQLVQGIITSVADVRGRIYLNFGANYRTDFTIAIAKADRKRFDKARVDPLSLEGAEVRVRGWIELMNGPMIWLDHPERLEVLN